MSAQFQALQLALSQTVVTLSRSLSVIQRSSSDSGIDRVIVNWIN